MKWELVLVGLYCVVMVAVFVTGWRRIKRQERQGIAEMEARHAHDQKVMAEYADEVMAILRRGEAQSPSE